MAEDATFRGDHQRIPDQDSQKKAKILFPPSQPGMTALNKSAFTKVIKVPTVLVPSANFRSVSEVLKPCFLKLSKFKTVQDNPSDTTKKRIYLNPELVPATFSELSEFLQQQLKTTPQGLEDTLTAECTELSVTYDNWRWWDILKAIIPDDFEKTRSFTMVGALLHLNLRDHLLPYKTVISQILLDGVPQARTVVNKVNTIDTTYRNFQMEVLAGDPSTIVKVRECGTEFEFDFATVYWNSRLSSEHERIHNYLKPGDILFDVFAGVGPFSLPAAKKECFVYANDLNPESYRWLTHNVNKTKKAKPYIKTWNLDGRAFVLAQFPHLIRKTPQAVPDFEGFERWTRKIHVTMNLPALAVEFLDVFWGLAKTTKIEGHDVDPDEGVNPAVSVTVHVYCFIKSDADDEECKALALELVKRKLRFTLPSDNVLEVFFVRNVAPNKNMFRVTFVLPQEILSTDLPPAVVPSPSLEKTAGEANSDTGADCSPSKRYKCQEAQ